MYCKECNKEISDPNSRVCPFCGNRDLGGPILPNQGMGEYKPINQTPYLVFAILATLLCCLPLGIPAIVFAAQIDGAQHAGNYEKAKHLAKQAKLFTIISAVLAVVFVVVYFLLVFAGMATAFGSYDAGFNY